MTKKNNIYKLNLEEVCMKNSSEDFKKIVFSFENHDDLFQIFEVLKNKNLFEEPQDAIEFSLGLKLFSEVMLRNRNNPLFEDFSPALGSFMKKLKQS